MTDALPTPACRYGYTAEQVALIMGNRHDEWNHWMRGSTRIGCQREDCGGTTPGPHGGVVFASDVRRFLAGYAINDD